MSDLPTCRWRSPCEGRVDRIVCGSDRVLTLSRDGCIPSTTCAGCIHADKPLRRPDAKLPCIHLGSLTGETRECESCKGRVRIKLRQCTVFGKCSPNKKLPGVACCVGCPSKEVAGVQDGS